ncbi:MAG: TonB-dependent receptor plug domain-containing protein [Pseudomonadota bacterium]|nr:TonB-dependent receptor plug domain-containing protein [Pseudomonadota bacterium]
MKPPVHPLVIALAVAALPAWAQDGAAALPEVTVKSPRLFDPGVDLRATDATLGASTLGASRAPAAHHDSASLLLDLPGASVQGAGGVSGLPVLRGLSDERLRVQVDGMDLLASCPNHMNPALSYIDPAQIGRITVFAGITPVSAGGDSLGGTVQVESAQPVFAAPGQDALLGGSVGGSYRGNGGAVGLNASAHYATEQLSLRYDGAFSRAGNYRAARAFKPAAPGTEQGQPLPGDEVASTSYRTQNHRLGAAWRQARNLWQVDLGWQHMPFQAFPNQRMDLTDNRSTQFNARYTGQFDWGDLKLRAWHQHVEHKMDMGGDRHTYGTGMPMLTDAATTGALAQANWLFSDRDTLRVGAEALRYRLFDWWPPVGGSGSMAPNSFWNLDDGRRDKLSAFAEWQTDWNPRWTTLLGLRTTHVVTDAGPVQGYSGLPTWADDAAAFNTQGRKRQNTLWDISAMARYTPDAGQSYEAGFARKTRAPSLYQRYPWSTNTMAAGMNNFLGDGNGYLGNPDLNPEVAYTLSVSGDWHEATEQPAWGVKANAYVTQIENYIDAVRCPATQCTMPGNLTATDSFVMLRYANQRARLLGLDVSGHWRFSDSAAAGRFTLTGALGLLHGKNLSTGDGLYNTMPPNLKLGLEHRISLGQGHWTTALDWHGVMAKTRVSAVRNEIKTHGYGLLNLRGSYELKGLRIDLGIDNLLNKAHALPLGGAYIGQGRSMMLNTVPWGVAVPGPGRSFYVGAQLTF